MLVVEAVCVRVLVAVLSVRITFLEKHKSVNHFVFFVTGFLMANFTHERMVNAKFRLSRFEVVRGLVSTLDSSSAVASLNLLAL